MSGERTPTELTNEQLAVRAQHDPAAFAPLYRRYITPIYAFCFQRLGARELAEDATSQTFLKALAALSGYRDGPENLGELSEAGNAPVFDGGWMFRVFGLKSGAEVIQAIDARAGDVL
ncbi:MAG TPA: sigma factor [Thermomicrobiales bacterium]|nr:sigma factor [Thermomicrobiales bacterium]